MKNKKKKEWIWSHINTKGQGTSSGISMGT